MKKHVTVIALLLVFASCLPLAAGTFSFIYYPRPVEWLDQYSQIGTALRNLIAQLDDYAATIITTYVPYTGATTNVNLGTKTITSTAAVGFVGTATVALTSPFATNATNSHKVDGYHVGHTSGTVPLADGTVCVGLTVDEDNVILDYLGASPYRNLSDWINVEDSSGLISGGTVVDNGDGTITDPTTGLMWTKNANHGEMTWSNAVVYCNNLVTNGYSDWRLPSVAHDEGPAELDTLFRENGNPSGAWCGVEGTPFTGVQNNGNSYWSRVSDASLTVRAWYVKMYNGYVGNGANKGASLYVWPVRGGQ